MKNKVDVFDLVQDFSDEIDNDNDLINLHLNLMYDELCEIYQLLYIRDVLDDEIESLPPGKSKRVYTSIGALLYESMTDHVILGLSRIFVGEKEYSIIKTINKISQMDAFKNNDGVKVLLEEFYNCIENSVMIPKIATLRDKVFAHRDKACIVTDARMFSTHALKNVDKEEVYEWILRIKKLWEICFEDKLHDLKMYITKDEIISTFLKDR